MKPSNSVKYLGLKIDNTLPGQEIVNSALSKCNYRLKFMDRFKDVLDLKTKKLRIQHSYRATLTAHQLPATSLSLKTLKRNYRLPKIRS